MRLRSGERQIRPQRVAPALAAIGQNYAEQDSTEQALSYYRQAVQAAQRAGDSAYAATVLDGIARYLDTIGQPAEAQAAFAEAATQWRRTDAVKAVTSLLSAGQISQRVEDYATAGDYAAQAQEIAESSRSAEARVKSYIAVGDAGWLQGAQDIGWTNYEQALGIAQQSNDRDLIATTLDKLASAHYTLRHYEEALETYGELLDVAVAAGDTELETYVRQRMWQSYLATRQFGAAEAIANRDNGIDSPANGASVAGVVSVKGLANGDDFDKWQLDLLVNGDEDDATFLDWSGSLPWWTSGRVWGTLTELDTTDYPNGSHKLRLRIVRPGGNYDEHFADIVISN